MAIDFTNVLQTIDALFDQNPEEEIDETTEKKEEDKTLLEGDDIINNNIETTGADMMMGPAINIDGVTVAIDSQQEENNNAAAWHAHVEEKVKQVNEIKDNPVYTADGNVDVEAMQNNIYNIPPAQGLILKPESDEATDYETSLDLPNELTGIPEKGKNKGEDQANQTLSILQERYSNLNFKIDTALINNTAKIKITAPNGKKLTIDPLNENEGEIRNFFKENTEEIIPQVGAPNCQELLKGFYAGDVDAVEVFNCVDINPDMKAAVMKNFKGDFNTLEEVFLTLPVDNEETEDIDESINPKSSKTYFDEAFYNAINTSYATDPEVIATKDLIAQNLYTPDTIAGLNELQSLYLGLPDISENIENLSKELQNIELQWVVNDDGKISGLADETAQKEWEKTTEDRRKLCQATGAFCSEYWYKPPTFDLINQYNRKIKEIQSIIKSRNIEIDQMNALLEGKEGDYSPDLQKMVDNYLNAARDYINEKYSTQLMSNKTLTTKYKEYGVVAMKIYEDFAKSHGRTHNPELYNIDIRSNFWENQKEMNALQIAKQMFTNIKRGLPLAEVFRGVTQFEKGKLSQEEEIIKLGHTFDDLVASTNISLRNWFGKESNLNEKLNTFNDLIEGTPVTTDMKLVDASKYNDKLAIFIKNQLGSFWDHSSSKVAEITVGEFINNFEKEIEDEKKADLGDWDRKQTALEAMSLLKKLEIDKDFVSIEGFMQHLGMAYGQALHMVPSFMGQTMTAAGTVLSIVPHPGAQGISKGLLIGGGALIAAGATVQGAMAYSSVFIEGVMRQMKEDPRYADTEITSQDFFEALQNPEYGHHGAAASAGASIMISETLSDWLYARVGGTVGGKIFANPATRKMMQNSFKRYIAQGLAVGVPYELNKWKEWGVEGFQDWLEQGFTNMAVGQDNPFISNIDTDQILESAEGGYVLSRLLGLGSVSGTLMGQSAISDMMIGTYTSRAKAIVSKLRLDPGSTTSVAVEKLLQNLKNDINTDATLNQKQKADQILNLSNIRSAALSISPEFRIQTRSQLLDLIIEQKNLEKNIKRVNNKQASVVEIERKNVIDAQIQELILAEHLYQNSLKGPTKGMGMFGIGAEDPNLKGSEGKQPLEDLDTLVTKWQQGAADVDVQNDILPQLEAAVISSLKRWGVTQGRNITFDLKNPEVIKEIKQEVGQELWSFIENFDKNKSAATTYTANIAKRIGPRLVDILAKPKSQKEMSAQEMENIADQETQETTDKEFKKRKYPTSIAAIEKQTADARPEILTNIKNSVKQFMASSVGKIKEIGKKGKTAITKLNPSSLAKELKAQNKATRIAVRNAMGKSVKAQNDFIKKVINDGYIETIPIAAMKKRFKNVKGFNIEKIGRETLGAGTGIYQLSGLQEQALIDFYTKDQSGRRSFIDLLAKGLIIEQFQEVKTDTEFMNDLAFKLKEANSALTAEEFMNEVERDYDGRTREFASLDKTESLKDKKPVKEITKSKVKKITIQKEGELTKKEKDEVIAKEKRVRDLDEIVPGTKETFGEARDRVVNEFLDQYPQWRGILRSATTHGIDRALFQTTEVFDRAIAKAKQIVKQITLGGKQIISGKKLNLKGLENTETKKFKDQQLKGIDDLIDLYKDFATFLQKNPKSAWVMGEIIADSVDAKNSIFRASASYGFYAIDKKGNPNTTEEGVAEHTKPNMAQQRPLTSAMMEGPAAVEALRPRVKATYMQGFFLKTDDNLVNINNKSTMPEVFYTDVLPAVERGDLDYLVKKYPGIVSWIRPAVAGVNPNFYKSTYNGKTIAEIFGVQVEKKYRNDPNVITAQNAAIIRILKGESKNKVLKDFKTWGKEIGIMQDNAALNIQKEAHTILEKKCSSPCRVPRTSKQVKKTLENSQDTQVNAQKVNKKKKGISVFDLDDTLAKTKEQVLASMPDGTLRRLTPAQFAEQADTLAEQGAEFDFSQFENVKGAKKGPLADLALRRQDKFGSGDIYVLTARPQASAQNIKLFLDGIGLNIPIENITGLEDGSPQAKADWVLSKTQEGYNDFYFADDSKMNVDAVKQILDQVDVKSKVQQAIADKETNLDKEFNEMLEESQGVKSQAEYSKSRAKLEGRKKDKGFFKWLGKQLTITPSAEDFLGLMYDLMGSGKQGNRHATWIQDNLIKPFNKAEQSILSAKVTVANDFAALKKSFPSLKSSLLNNPLMDQIGVGPYTKSHAIRIYMWNKQGMEIPGLSKRDQNALVKAVENDAELMSFADNVILIQKDKQYPAPEENWVAGTIDSDLMNSIDTTSRRKEMTEFDENVKIIFSEKNLLKLEAIYGKKWVDALKDSLRRMKSGSNRPVYQGGGSRIVNELLDWLNGSVGAIMFVNMRSGLLQLISNINFINWGDNNIYQAAKAFASKEYWPTVLKLMNSDYLVNRRDGLKINVNEAELANAAKDGGMKGAIAYLLDKGFIITRIMDSLAISTGGATFYINRRNALLKRQNPETGKKYTQAEAEAQAFDDFYAIAEETQQSSNPSKISQQQASLAGRVILSFQNVTMQYNRKVKKSIRNLYNRRKNPGMTQRESDMSNLSQIIYYTTIQNVIFHSLQQTLFALLFDDETEDEEKDRLANIANGMADSLLFGLGFGGAGISTVKNVLLKIMGEHEKKNPKYEEAVWAIFDFSPVLDSKVRKMRTGLKTFSWNMEEIKKRGWSLDNPAYLAIGQMISATFNIPLDRVLRKTMNLRAAMDEETRTWQRVALILGWDTWSLGLPYWGLQSTIAKENKEKAKIKANYKADIRKIKDQGYKKVMSRVLKDYDPKDIIELQSPAGTVVYYAKVREGKKAKN